MENGKNLIDSFNHSEGYEGNFSGLTKREYFAGLAMQGLLAGNAIYYSDMPNDAVRLADKLLIELQKTN